MDLALSQDEEQLAAAVRSFIAREAGTDVLVQEQRTEPGHRPAWSAAMADAGWSGILIPEDDGGAGATALQAAVVAEELGKGPLPGPFLASSAVAALLIAATDPGTARDEVLTGIAAGTRTVVPALVPAGTTWAGLTRAGEFAEATEHGVSGEFPFVPYAGSATDLLVPVRGDDTGVEFALVPADGAGVATRVLDGFLAHNHEVLLNGAQATATFTADRAAVAGALARSYVIAAAYSVGGCQVLLDRSVEYSRTREQFGGPIGRFQRVQDHIVELINALDTARWMLYEALWQLDSGQDAFAGAHRAKAVAAEAYITCADAAHKVHGGIGVDPDFGITLYTQQSRSLYGYLGDPRWHKRRMVDALGWTA